MQPRLIVSFLTLLVCLLGGVTMVRADNVDVEKAGIRKVIEASIGWALNKDFDLLYRSLAQDSNFFIYHPDNASTIIGFAAFKDYAETIFKGDQFRATRFEVKNLRVNLSASGEVAWYSCLLDDFGEWNGKPGGWENCRWTGVLERREDKWVIVQMHFSFATDQERESKNGSGSGPNK